MIRKLLFTPLLLIWICASHQAVAQFSGEDVGEDLTYLYESLKEAHFNLYAYTTAEAFDSTYLELRKTITSDSLSLLEATNILQRLPAAVNNGHTAIDFPGQSYGEYAHAGGTVFPLEIAFEAGRPLIRKNWSANDSIMPGMELLGINGSPIADILSKIYPQISAERLYFKNAKLELYSFPRYYWQVFGKQDEFDVDIRENDMVQTYTLKAIRVIEDYEMKRNEILSAVKTLKFFGQSAYLNPGNFTGDEGAYRKFIDSSFVIINERKSANLILDLRNNGGGDDSFSDYLVSYIAVEPFKWNSAYSLKTSEFLKAHTRKYRDTTEVFWQEVLSHNNGEIYDYAFESYPPQPAQKRFIGNVYVLVNRQSHSQSAVTAAQIQDYKFGTIVGEETGEYPSLYASIFQYQLPRTGIQVSVSKGHITRVNGSTKAEGVIPDIFIKDYLLDETDEVLDGLLSRLH